MMKLRVILDTNVLISGLLVSFSTPQKVFDLVTQKETLLISEFTFAEIYATLMRDKFNKYISWEKRLRFLTDIREKAEVIQIVEVISVCRDPKDNKFLELAIAGNATHIITGDKDLLELNPFRDVVILTPTEFLEIFSDCD